MSLDVKERVEDDYIVSIKTQSGIMVGLLVKDGKFDVEYNRPNDFTEAAKLFFDAVITHANSLIKEKKDGKPNCSV